MPTLRFDMREGVLTVYLAKVRILDDTTTHEIGEQLMGLVDQAEVDGMRIVVDCHGVQFMSSAMIGRLLLLHKSAKQRHVPLTFSKISPAVMKVFRVTRLDKVFQCEAEETACGADPVSAAG